MSRRRWASRPKGGRGRELLVQRSGLLSDSEHLAGGGWEEAGLRERGGQTVPVHHLLTYVIEPAGVHGIVGCFGWNVNTLRLGNRSQINCS